LTEEDKIKDIEEAGIIVSKLKPIETCLHTINRTNEQEKIQVDFNIYKHRLVGRRKWGETVCLYRFLKQLKGSWNLY